MNPQTWDAPKLVIYAALFCLVFLRAGATYAAGRGLIAGMSRTRFATRIQSHRYRQATELVARYGAPVVAVCFLTVGFQSLVLLAAGGLRMPLRRFIPALVAGSTLWALLYGTVGFVGFQLWLALYDFSPPLTISGTAAVLITVVVLVLRGRARVPQPDAESAGQDAQLASQDAQSASQVDQRAVQ